MRIALLNGLEGGHHLTYARLYARALAQLGHQVVALVPDPAAVLAWLQRVEPQLSENVKALPFRGGEPGPARGWLARYRDPLARWAEAARAVRVAGRRTGWAPQAVFFPWLDDLLSPGSRAVRVLLPAVFPWRWSGIYYHPRHLRVPGECDASERLLQARNCGAVALLDEGVAEKLSQRLNKPVVFLPDVTDEELPARDTELVSRIRSAAAGRPIVAMLGGMEKRKGVLDLLDVLEGGRRPDWFFLFAGTLGEGIDKTFSRDELARLQSAASERRSNAFFHLQRVEDEGEFNALFRLCSSVVAVYDDFPHSSGILTKAAVFGRPVVVAEGFFMAERVRDYRLGVAVKPHDSAALEHAIASVLCPESLRRTCGEPLFPRYRERHCAEQLARGLEALLPHLG